LILVLLAKTLVVIINKKNKQPKKLKTFFIADNYS